MGIYLRSLRLWGRDSLKLWLFFFCLSFSNCFMLKTWSAVEYNTVIEVLRTYPLHEHIHTHTHSAL